MTPEQIERNRQWVAALRSGEIRQAIGKLRKFTDRGDGYCCLGVACELYRETTGEGEWEGNLRGNYQSFILGASQESNTAPVKVQDWFGWGSVDPLLDADNDPGLVPRTASQLNDTGYTFHQIALFIEEKFKLKEEADVLVVPDTPRP